MINTFSEAFQKLKDPKRRRRFIANQIKNGFAFQVRALRKARDLTQQQLASDADTTQALISRLEKSGAGNMSVKTLQKIADAFDVALVVRFEPIDRLLDWVNDLSPSAMAPAKSSDVLAAMEKAALRESVAFGRNTGARMAVRFQIVPSNPSLAPQMQLPCMYSQPCEVARTETQKQDITPEISQSQVA